MQAQLQNLADTKTIDDFERVLDQEEAWLKAQKQI